MTEREVLLNPEFVYRKAYEEYLRRVLRNENPSREEMEKAKTAVSPHRVDQINYEVELKVGVPAVHPKKGN